MKLSATQSNFGTPLPLGRDCASLCRQGLLAFTLIEVLIALAIFAILLAAIDGLLFGAMHLQAKANAAIEEVQPADRAATIIKRDILSMVPPGGLICGGVLGGTYTGAGDNNLPLAGLSAVVNLEFYTANGIIDDQNYWGDIQKIDYSLQTATNKANAIGRDLVRCVTHNVLTLAQDIPDQQRLLENVQALTVTFFDGTNWNDSWGTPDTSTVTNLPTAIRFRVEFATDRLSPAVKAPMELLFPIATSLVNTNLL